MSQPKDYDTTIARIAGNIAVGLVRDNVQYRGADDWTTKIVAESAVNLARAIVTEVKRTEPPKAQA